METPTNQQRANRWVKYMGGFFVLWALAGLAVGVFPWPIASCTLAAGLFQLLFAPERIDDERVKHLKLRAIMCGYGAGFTLLVLHDFIGKFLVKETRLPALTAFEGFVIATAIALGLFHYWRWQDGRVEKSA